jgi:hypothetical protein
MASGAFQPIMSTPGLKGANSTIYSCVFSKPCADLASRSPLCLGPLRAGCIHASLRPRMELAYRYRVGESGGAYQIGDDQPRCWIFSGASWGNGRPFWIASSVLHRGVGISSTRR